MRTFFFLSLLVCSLTLLPSCTTDPSGRQGIRLPDCSFSLGGKYPMPTHCRYQGASVPIPGTGR